MKTARKVTTHKAAMTGIYAVKRLLKLGKGVKVFSQGARADAIFFVRTGKVQVTVISAYGKEAVVRTVGPHDFFGEECLVGGSLRTSTATSSGPSTVFRIETRAMLQALHIQSGFSHEFVASLLVRNVNLEQDLCDQLFNHTERRLARILLKLARFRNQHQKLPDIKGQRVTHTSLAEMVGASRSRIGFLMNKFRKMGLINYKGKGDITVTAQLLTDVVLASS
jgi:CRP/FNR family cyclic AMP-dependent transcriptional regulator